jgi:hypothetical protein
VVVETFAHTGLFQWNALVAWVAILIDFLEVPVILDTLRRVWVERHEIVARLRRGDRRPVRQPHSVRAHVAAGAGD